MVKMKKQLSDIKISCEFQMCAPKEFKMNACRKYWNKYHRQERSIVVDRDNLLVDGYVMYLVLKENGIEETEVEVLDAGEQLPELTTYVYGIHDGSRTGKEYVWRVPKSWTKFSSVVKSGDTIACNTVYGRKKVIVTRVSKLEDQPINMKIRKVSNMWIYRNDEFIYTGKKEDVLCPF